MDLSPDDIAKLAPDDASLKAAKGLANPGKWSMLQHDDDALWGACKGSGSKPYQVQIDCSGPAFKCSCPSRKFPCKHGLALLMLWQQCRPQFSSDMTPDWVSQWLASRKARTDKQQAKAAAPASAGAVQAPQTLAKRQARMAAGLAELQLWLADTVRQGLAQLGSQPEIWQAQARRMVDAQLPGIAERLRQLEFVVGRDHNWPEQLLGAFGQLQLLIDGFARMDTLPAPVQADLQAALGLSLERDAVCASADQVTDDWLVVGQSCDERDRLWARRTWLLGGQSGRRALLLDFAHGSRSFELNFFTGMCYRCTLAFYPSAAPLRALPLAAPQAASAATHPPAPKLEQATAALTQALAANPWQWPQPLLLGEVTAEASGKTFVGLVGEQCRLPLHIAQDDGWRLLAESGGQPLSVFGEWDGERLRPLSAWNPGLIWQEAGA